MPSARRRLAPIAVLAGYGTLAVALFWAPLTSGGRLWVGVPRDAELFIWYLGWVPYAVGHGLNPFVSNFIHYPGVVNGMWNTSIAFPSLALWPVTAGFGPVTAYDVLITLSFAFSGWLAYLAARRFVTSEVAAAVAGLLYGFSPFMVSQAIGHAHLVVALFPPLALLLGHELLVARRWPPWTVGVLAGVAAACQLLTSEEVLATAAVVAVAWVALAAVLWPGRLDRALVTRALPALLVAGVTFAALAAFPLWVQFRGPERVAGLLQVSNTYVSALAGFVVPTVLQHFNTPGSIGLSSTLSGNGSEDNAYVGIPLLAVALGAVLWLRTRAALWALLAALAAAALSLGPRLHVTGPSTAIRLPWALVQRLPLFQNVLPSRIMVFAFLALGLLLALLLDAARRSRSRTVQLAAGVAVALALVPLWPLTPYPSSEGPAPSFFLARGGAGRLHGEVVLLTPITGGEPMRWQAQAGMGFRQVGGTAFIPGPIFGPPSSPLLDALAEIEDGGAAPSLGAAERASLLADLRRLAPDAIVVGPTAGTGATAHGGPAAQQAELRLLQSLLGQPPQASGGVYVWWRPAIPVS